MRRVAVVAIALSAFLLLAGVARAGWVYWTYADGTDVPINGSWIYYTTHRVVHYAPYGIWFQKYDGPAMYARWWDCANQGYGYGPIKSVSNADPAPGVYLKDNGSSPSYLEFCLAFKNANNNYDTFTGALNWDGNY
jgi:hypothetical protein